MDRDSLFIAHVAHELRGPLTLLAGYAELVQNDSLSGEQRTIAGEKIARAVERLDRLVSSLQALAGGRESAWTLVDLGQIARTASEAFREAHPAVQLHLDLPDDPVLVRGDEPLLLVALSNLLTNAVRYSESPAQIAVTLRHEGDAIQLAVTDRGIGIPADCISRLFDRFFVVDPARSRRLGGTGLGLAIVKEIIDRHQGDIQVQSTLGGGSRFTLLFNKTISTELQ